MCANCDRTHILTPLCSIILEIKAIDGAVCQQYDWFSSNKLVNSDLTLPYQPETILIC